MFELPMRWRNWREWTVKCLVFRRWRIVIESGNKNTELAFLIHHSDSGGCRWEQSEDLNLADNMGTIQELQMVLNRKDDQIRDLKTMLKQKEEEIQQLQSHLDKYQSVFSLWKPGQAVSRNSRATRRFHWPDVPHIPEEWKVSWNIFITLAWGNNLLHHETILQRWRADLDL